MDLTEKDVKGIAHLARIGLEEAALAPLAKDLSNVLTLVEQLEAANTDGVEPLAHPGHSSLRLRDDTVSEENQRETLQSPAPDTRDGYFLVPRVIE